MTTKADIEDLLGNYTDVDAQSRLSASGGSTLNAYANAGLEIMEKKIGAIGEKEAFLINIVKEIRVGLKKNKKLSA